MLDFQETRFKGEIWTTPESLIPTPGSSTDLLTELQMTPIALPSSEGLGPATINIVDAEEEDGLDYSGEEIEAKGSPTENGKKKRKKKKRKSNFGCC